MEERDAGEAVGMERQAEERKENKRSTDRERSAGRGRDGTGKSYREGQRGLEEVLFSPMSRCRSLSRS